MAAKIVADLAGRSGVVYGRIVAAVSPALTPLPTSRAVGGVFLLTAGRIGRIISGWQSGAVVPGRTQGQAGGQFLGYCAAIRETHMAVGPYKVTYLANFRASGFSETWTYNLTASLAAADFASIEKLGSLRAKMFGGKTTLEAIRIADIANPRAVQVIQRGQPTKTTFDQTNDVASAAWLAMVRGAGGQGRRQIWLRGAPDIFIAYNDATGQFLKPPELVANFEAYKKELTSGRWVIAAKEPLGGAGVQQQFATSIQANTFNTAEIRVAATPWDSNSAIVVTGFRKPWSYLNGTYSPGKWYKSAGPVAVNLEKPVALNFSQASIAGVRIRGKVPSYVAIDTIDLVRPGSRRTGRGFFAPSGRR